MDFSLRNTDGQARAGTVHTDHGAFETPAFMPVGTQGTVKAITPEQLRQIGAQVILSNTYHLYLRPGTEILQLAGGLHKLMSWERPILTDSGGYQVFSLSDLRKLDEDGVTFKSHLDGSLHRFTPESVIDVQRAIGSDIMMVLDECTPFPCERSYAEKSNERTLRWARRCLSHYRSAPPLYGHRQTLFGIVQGSVMPEVRRHSAARLVEMEFEGYAIGGLAVGEPAELMYEMIEVCNAILPVSQPRYLMGVGTPENLLEAIERGVDMFDCVLPTRNGRNAMFFTRNGAITITNAMHKADLAPVDDGCACYCCANFSRAYLRHLFQSKEILGLQLATIHNLHFYQWLMRSAREAIAGKCFQQWKLGLLNSLNQTIAKASGGY
jgi:queuine tRNA-ribosyltransferase